MSRYLLLFLLNTPVILAGLLSVLTQYKLRRISSRKFIIHASLWGLLLLGLGGADFIYTWLFNNNLTQTDSLSLFDVIQITLIVYLLYTTNRIKTRHDQLSQRVNTLQQKLSIKLSEVKED